MKKWNMVIDAAKCEDCNNCFLSCKDEYVDNSFPGYSESQPLHGHRWINIMRKERGSYPIVDAVYLPIPCMHCQNAPCEKAAGGDAVYRRQDGIVMIDPVKARGMKEIVKACPYNAVWWNDDLNLPQKCSLCAHLLDQGWSGPRCSQACPTGAIQILSIEDSEMQGLIEKEELEVLHPEYNTSPRVYYKNLYRYMACFIAGSITEQKDNSLECAEGVSVSLFDSAGALVGKATTDNFGDFRIDRLAENSGAYKLEFQAKGGVGKSMEVNLTESINVGVIKL